VVVSDRELRFGVLGPLAIWDGDGSVRVGGKQRVLLTALLFNHGRPASTDQLVDALWPDGPPASAVANLHTYVSVLRASLPPHPVEERIRRHANGYSISVAPGELDLRVFEELIAESGELKALGRLPEATRLLEGAVELWRGDPVEDVPPSHLWQAEAARLVERWLGAVEDLCALRLAAGRHADNVVRLRSLLVTYPLREGLWQQLMLALHAGGRQAEALDAYAEMRERLVAELGTEPGPRLRRIHEALLRGTGPFDDDSGDDGDLFPACQLPADTPDFTGREASARELVEALRSGTGAASPPVVVVTGTPGVGKSAFAVHVCHRLRDRFPDGQLYLDLTGGGGQPRIPGEVLVEVLRTLGVTGAAIPRSLSERAALYRSKLADRRVLVLVDGATDAAQVRPLLPGTSGSATVVTSRRQLPDLAGARHLELQVFGPDEAIHLLSSIAGTERVAREPDEAAAIARMCGSLPLAIRIAGAKLSGRQRWSLETLAGRLEDESRRLSELEIGDLGVRATFDMGVRPLKPVAARAFRYLGLLGIQEGPGWVVGELLDRPDGDDVLDELIDASLAQALPPDASGAPRYRLHDLLRQYAREAAAAEPEEERIAAITRLLGAWLGVAEAAAARLPASLLTPRPGPARRRRLDPALTERLVADPVTWFDTERRALLDAVALAAEYGLAGLAWELAIAVVPYFDLRSLYEDWRSSHEQALQAVRAVGDLHGEAALLRTLGQVFVYQDDYDEAVGALERSRELCGRIGEARGVALAEVGLGTVHRVLSRYERALAHYHAALPVISGEADRHIEAQVRASVGGVLADLGRTTEAYEWLEAALECARDSADRHREARIVGQLADLDLLRDDPTSARTRLEAALAVFDDLEDDRCAAYVLLGLARCRPADGEAMLARALDTFRRFGNRRGLAAGLQVLSELRMAEGDLEAADRLLRQAAMLWHDLGDEAQEAAARERQARLRVPAD
jgi:DNA-binding SARP family transcriptional activator/tetratricopeptide (TPR) repeat protein